jgi:hypothetical protein
MASNTSFARRPVWRFARAAAFDVDAGPDKRDVRSSALSELRIARGLDAVVGVFGHFQRAQRVAFEAVAWPGYVRALDARQRVGRGRGGSRIGHVASVALAPFGACVGVAIRRRSGATIVPMAETALTTVADADVRLPAIVAPPADAPTLAELFVFMGGGAALRTLRMRIVDRTRRRAAKRPRSARSGCATHRTPRS